MRNVWTIVRDIDEDGFGASYFIYHNGRCEECCSTYLGARWALWRIRKFGQKPAKPLRHVVYTSEGE